jgi:hypothetical protein
MLDTSVLLVFQLIYDLQKIAHSLERNIIECFCTVVHVDRILLKHATKLAVLDSGLMYRVVGEEFHSLSAL